MTATTLELAIGIFGLALLFWAITSTDRHPGARAAGAGIGLIALLLALILRNSDDHHHDWEGRL